MESKVKKWGNSLGIRIPKSFTDQVGITNGSSIDITIEGDKITIAPILRKDESINELLSLVTEDNVPYEIKTDGPVGNEIW